MNQTSLRTKLQQIAKNKINKSQQKEKIIKNKVRVAKNRTNKRTNVAKSTNNKVNPFKITFFPEIPVGFFGYSRPAEARLQSEKVRELTERFKNQLNKKKVGEKKQTKISQVSKELLFEDYLQRASIPYKKQNNKK